MTFLLYSLMTVFCLSYYVGISGKVQRRSIKVQVVKNEYIFLANRPMCHLQAYSHVIPQTIDHEVQIQKNVYDTIWVYCSLLISNFLFL